MPAMLDAKRIIIIVLPVCAILVPVCSAGTTAAMTERKRLKALVLLDKYAETRCVLSAYDQESSVCWGD